MQEDIRRNVYIETNLQSYRNFFSDDWGERIDKLTAHVPKLSPLVFDLMMEWRAAAYTVSLPLSILEHVKEYHDGFVTTGDVNTTLLRLAALVLAKLSHDMPDLSADPPLVRRLRARIVDLGAQLEEARDVAQFEFPMDETWRSYIEHPVYQLSLWGSQRICYVSIYNSYENFLTQCVRIARSLDRCRTSDKEFKSHLVAAFGEHLRDTCWTTSELHIARLARHALSHAGGRITDDLAQQRHAFVVCDSRIQVTPENTKALFATLKNAVHSLAEKAITLPAFK